MNPYNYGLWTLSPDEVKRRRGGEADFRPKSEKGKVKLTKAILDELQKEWVDDISKRSNKWGRREVLPRISVWLDGKVISMDLDVVATEGKTCHEVFITMLDKSLQLRFKQQLGIKYGSRGVRFKREEVRGGKHTKPSFLRHTNPKDS